MSSHEKNSQYIIDLNDIDVLCGRGSGPNGRTGNIEFRNLVLARKVEYLATSTRYDKGRIAAEIVEGVRSRGGRFLKKISPAQAKDAGFERGVDVYELADEPTVLEKAKQNLRQGRADFVAKVTMDQTGVADLCRSDGPTPIPIGSEGLNMAMCNAMMPANSGVHFSGGMRETASLDSMQRPVFSASTAEELNAALFASPVNISMGGDSANSGRNTVKNSMDMLNQAVQMISSESTQGCAGTEMASDIYATLGSNQSGSSNGQPNDISAMSTNIVDSFQALTNETNVNVQRLKQNSDELKFQQQQQFGLHHMHQQDFNPCNVSSSFNNGSTYMPFIPEDQQTQFQPYKQQQLLLLQQLLLQQQNNATLLKNVQQFGQQQAQREHCNPCNVTSSFSNGQMPKQDNPEGQHTHFQPYECNRQQNLPEPVNGSSTMFDSLGNRHISGDESSLLLHQLHQQQLQLQKGQSSDMLSGSDQNHHSPSQTSNDNDTSSISPGSLTDDKLSFLQLYEQEQKKLLTQYKLLHQQRSVTNNVAPSNEQLVNSSNNAVPNNLETRNSSSATGSMDRRPSRITSRGKKVACLSAIKNSSQAVSNLKASYALPNVEPIDFQNVSEESLRLSFLTANWLAATLKEDVSSGSSAKHTSKEGSLRHSLLTANRLSATLEEEDEDMSPGSFTQHTNTSALKRSNASIDSRKRRHMLGSFNASERSIMSITSIMSLSLSLSEVESLVYAGMDENWADNSFSLNDINDP